MTDGRQWESAPPRRRALPLIGMVVVAIVAGALVGTGSGLEGPPPDELVVEEASERPVPTAPQPLSGPQIDGEWQPMAQPPIAGRVGAAAAWTGEQVLIWGGVGGGAPRDDGALYDPRRDVWRTIAPSPLPPRYGAAAVENEGEVVVAGGVAVDRRGDPGDAPQRLRDVAAYDPRADRWRLLPPAPFPVVDGRLFAHNGRLYAVAEKAQRRPAAVLDRGSGMWRAVPPVEWDARGDAIAAAVVDDVLVLWPAGRRDAVALHLVAQQWFTAERGDARAISSCGCVMTPGRMPSGLVDVAVHDLTGGPWWRRHLGTSRPSFAGGSATSLFLVYSPGPTRVLDRRTAQMSWLPLEPRALGYQPVAVWTGRQLVLWGGVSGSGLRFTTEGMVFTPGTVGT